MQAVGIPAAKSNNARVEKVTSTWLPCSYSVGVSREKWGKCEERSRNGKLAVVEGSPRRTRSARRIVLLFVRSTRRKGPALRRAARVVERGTQVRLCVGRGSRCYKDGRVVDNSRMVTPHRRSRLTRVLLDLARERFYACDVCNKEAPVFVEE